MFNNILTKLNKNMINKYLKTRGVFFFIIFALGCLSASLPVSNLFVDILSHFKLQYIYISMFFTCLFIYLSFLNRKFIVFILAALILMIINGAEIRYGFGKPQFSQARQGIKIGVFNVLTRNENYSKLKLEINKENPDIIILQEVDDIWLNNIQDIKNNYPYHLEHARTDNFGISIYSKLPLINSRVESWTNYEIPVLNAQLQQGSKLINLYCIHTLPPTGMEYFKTRNEMLENISRIVLDNPEKSLIFAGDMNTTVFARNYKQLISSTNLDDAQVMAKNLQGTWNSKFLPIFRISLEHILFTNDIKFKSFKIGKNFGSDHLPVFVELNSL